MRTRDKMGLKFLALAIALTGLLALELAFFHSAELAEKYDRAIGAQLRSALSHISGVFPFSITEFFLLLLPLLSVLLLAFGVIAAESAVTARRYLFRVLFGGVFFLSLYVLTFSPGHHRPPLEVRIELDLHPPTATELAATAEYLSSLASYEMPPSSEDAWYSALKSSYRALGERYGIGSNPGVKPKYTVTPLFLRLGFFGLYTFPLGEVTVTSECPDTMRAFTLAHEMAHAAGYTDEAEADLVAFLACLESGEPYLRAAGATAMLTRLLSVLEKDFDTEWRDASNVLPPEARREISDSNALLSPSEPTLLTPPPKYDRTILLLCAFLRKAA